MTIGVFRQFDATMKRLFSVALGLLAVGVFIAGFFGAIVGFIVGLIAAWVIGAIAGTVSESASDIERQIESEKRHARAIEDWKALTVELRREGWDFEYLHDECASIQRGNIIYHVNVPGARKLLGEQISPSERPEIAVSHVSPEYIRTSRKREINQLGVTNLRAKRIREEMARHYSPEEIENKIISRMSELISKFPDALDRWPAIETLRKLLLNLTSDERDVLTIAKMHDLDLDLIFGQSL